MNPYPQFVREFANLLRAGRRFPLGGFPPLPRPALVPDAAKVLLFSPHPDDEVIIGGLPLRLLREAKMRVVNVAVTQGSSAARQKERWAELVACCECIGFELVATSETGLEGVNLKGRDGHPERWGANVNRIAEILREHQPHTIVFPHDRDWNGTHIGVHHLVVAALRSLGPEMRCFTVETEFWGAMDDPNLMVESSEQDVADMMTALSFHVGEVRRNPYHLRTPAWMIDNVRRGGELVGGQGGAAPDFPFATLYRLRKWEKGAFTVFQAQGRFLSREQNPAGLFAGT